MRKNGWQTPFHPLQVVAIAIFFAMVIAFQVFLRPFTGRTAMQYAALSLYTTMVVVVLVLYAWCVVVNPADPGVLCLSTSCNISGSQPRETPTLYCTLCKVDILKNSRHCRSCDKCVDGFDHHCQWLNNCVGRRNYRVFFGLLVGTIFMLVLMWSLGLWVLIHGFLSKRGFHDTIAHKLGSSFPFVAYIGVVASCTLLAMLATYPLCHLLIFHVVLCWKGISTHDFVLAMRDLQHIQASEAAGDSDGSVVCSTKTSSGSCSSQGQGWCTPPRIVFDHEESIIQPEHFVSSNDVEDVSRRNEVDVVSRPREEEAERVKAAVNLNPWKLASMNKVDLLRSSTISVSRSSVLRPAALRNETSSSSSSHKGSTETRIVCAKKSASNDSCSAHVIEVRSRLSHDLPKESLITEGLVKPSKASSEALQLEGLIKPSKASSSALQLEGLIKPSTAKTDTLVLLPAGETRPALDATKKLVIGRVFVLPSDGIGGSSESFHLRQGQIDMPVPRNSAGWRWRQNPTFDAKGCISVENSDEVMSLPCTPTKRIPTFTLHRLSSM